MLDTDKAAALALAQAAVEVELFTIPLYMATMYSIHGTHQINSKWLSYYKGRQWPGMSTSARAGTPESKAFNIIFSVFIQEMLHLQMAANLTTALGGEPCFTGPALQTPDHGWHCFGPDKSVIPHIVDLKDTNSYTDVRVNLEELNANQCNLFRAIEQPEDAARTELAQYTEAHPDKYFPQVPFADWTPLKKASDLPLFGTIGYMYECFAQYISMTYEDGQTLWQKMFVQGSVQQDMFNSRVKGHPLPEFPGFSPYFLPEEQHAGQDITFNKAIDMMAAITDQGEGNASSIKRYRRSTGMLKAVQPDYRESDEALKAGYPSYSNDGGRAQSADAAARFHYTAYDHYERFGELMEIASKVQTWAQWHAAGNTWTTASLTNEHYNASAAPENIPSPADVAGALNRLKEGGSETWNMLSTVSTGAIYGITRVLDDYWQDQDTTFPYPSMVGAGDRVSICWAVLGKAPDLSTGVPLPDETKLYHACQGMSLSQDPSASAASGCAALAVYHTCRGSNGCEATGGCGFAQLDTGGGSCGHAVKTAPLQAQNLCGGPKPSGPTGLYSAPADNKCRTFGGCAVPISASQLYPGAGTMALYDFGPEPQHKSIPLTNQTISFALGDNVYVTAWEAYSKVMESRGQQAGDPPAPTDLRLALPPST
jgi:hypothetical protein